MVFNSIYFLFAFLPLSLILYYISPKKIRNYTMVLISLVFYAWGTPEYILLLLFSILFNYITGIEIQHFQDEDRPGGAKFMMIAAVVVNLLILGFYKYYGFLIGTINSIAGLKISAPNLPLPLGISFYTFTVLSYVFDVYRMKVPAQKNIGKFALYVSFFPKVISGPIVQYTDLEEQLSDRKMIPAKFGFGLNMFIVGLAKKVLLADNLGVGFAAITAMENMSAATAWLGLILYAFQLYFDFSGYSDMAIGLAKMFGFNLDKNFDYPYLSSSVAEFWRRWHISLGAWFREYIYIPMGGNRCSKGKVIRNFLVVWALTGLWHGSSWNFVLWGFYHCGLILLERFVLKDFLEKVPKAIRVFFTALMVFFGWSFFFTSSLGESFHFIGQLFGMGGLGFLDATAKYYWSGNIILLILSVIGATPISRGLHQQLTYTKGNKVMVLSLIGYVALLILSIAYMVGATYSSFLYFQF